MELRYRPRARTTRDIDLTCAGDSATPLSARLAGIRDQIQEAAEADLHDFLTFRIGPPATELTGAPLGGARFPCEAFLAGKAYGRFHIDLGFGDDPGDAPEIVMGDDLMAFADIPPARVLAIPKPQQFAEKIHDCHLMGTIEWTVGKHEPAFQRLRVAARARASIAVRAAAGSCDQSAAIWDNSASTAPLFAPPGQEDV